MFIPRNINFEFWVCSNLVNLLQFYGSMDNVTGLLCWCFFGISVKWPKCSPFRTLFSYKNATLQCCDMLLCGDPEILEESDLQEQNQSFLEGAALGTPVMGCFAVQISHRNSYSCHWRNECHRLVGFVHWTQNRSWAIWILFLLFLLIVVTLNRTHKFLLCLIFRADKRG